MKKILFGIFILFYIFIPKTFSYKCDKSNLAYFSNSNHYYKNLDLCEEKEVVSSFETIEENLSRDFNFDGKEKGYIFSLRSEKDSKYKARIIKNGKTFQEISYKSDVLPVSKFSTSGKHIFTFFIKESGVKIYEEDKKNLGFYVDGKKILDFLDDKYSSLFLEKYGFSIGEENLYSKGYLTEIEISKIEKFLSVIKKYNMSDKKIITSKIKELLIDLHKNGISNLSEKDYRKFLILNYIQQEIFIDIL